MQENVNSKVALSRYFEKKVLESIKRWKIFTKGEMVLSTFMLHHDNLEEQNIINKK